jgi:hypothetical protein
MYKKQMILQRITSFIALAAAALVFVYSLGIITDVYDSLNLVSTYKKTSSMYVEGSEVYLNMQEFNQQLTTAGIILILTAVALFVFQTHTRRKYYIANYITVGVNAVANIAVSVWALPKVFEYKQEFLAIDFIKLKEISLLLPDLVFYTESTFWFDISIFVFSFVFLATALSIGNLVLKIILMKNEKLLIAEGKEA